MTLIKHSAFNQLYIYCGSHEKGEKKGECFGSKQAQLILCTLFFYNKADTIQWVGCQLLGDKYYSSTET